MSTTVQQRLHAEFRIEAPLGRSAGQCGIRVSVQAYNTMDDIDALIDALRALLA